MFRLVQLTSTRTYRTRLASACDQRSHIGEFGSPDEQPDAQPSTVDIENFRTAGNLPEEGSGHTFSP